MKKKLFTALAIIFTTMSLNANHLVVSGGTQVDFDKVTFTISWENSWWVSGAPSNHDAAWIFIK